MKAINTEIKNGHRKLILSESFLVINGLPTEIRIPISSPDLGYSLDHITFKIIFTQSDDRAPVFFLNYFDRTFTLDLKNFNLITTPLGNKDPVKIQINGVTFAVMFLITSVVTNSHILFSLYSDSNSEMEKFI
jgi:hypothetical protein